MNHSNNKAKVLHINKKLLKITESLIEKLEDRNNPRAAFKMYQQRDKKVMFLKEEKNQSA